MRPTAAGGRRTHADLQPVNERAGCDENGEGEEDGHAGQTADRGGSSRTVKTLLISNAARQLLRDHAEGNVLSAIQVGDHWLVSFDADVAEYLLSLAADPDAAIALVCKGGELSPQGAV